MASDKKQLIDPVAIGVLVSQACQSFELLERFHDGSVVLSPSFSQWEGVDDLKNTCQRALVMHFVFLVARLYRLCSKFESSVAMLFAPDAIRKFCDGVKPIISIRNPNEHGLEPGARSTFNPELASYSVPGLGELSMVHDERMFRRVNGVPYMGNVELRPIYEATKEFEKVAGFIPAHHVRQELFTRLHQTQETGEHEQT